MAQGFRNLTEGKAYRVGGMIIYRNVLSLLVRNNIGSPSWPPAGYFEVVDDSVPSHWHFRLGGGAKKGGRELWADPLTAIWGYPELVCKPGGLDALSMDREREAMTAFRRETELDQAP